MLGRGITVAILWAGADQLAKFWILTLFAGDPDIRQWIVTGFFNLVLTFNRGISFGIFNTGSAWNAVVFAALAAVIVVALLWWLRRVENTLLAIGIGLIIGGAVGNAIDRVARGAVVDFLDFHLGQWHPFAFNLADAGISLGVGLLILDGLMGRRRKGAMG